MPIYFLIGITAFIMITWWIIRKIKQSHRELLFQKPIPASWQKILEKNVSLYHILPAELKPELYGRMNIFMDEKEFYGCADLEVTEEMIVTIAANACILLLNRDKKCFPGFTSILIYPDTYVAKQVNYDGYVEIHEDSHRAGEAWHRGPVVLSWSDVLHGSLDHSDGHNVVLHEFAHKLDEENTIMDGLPVLRNNKDYAEWAEVLSKEYESLLIRVDKGKNTVIDSYGASSPVEFFAVATESFFEKPVQMQTKLPELYAQLKKFYGLDPASWR